MSYFEDDLTYEQARELKEKLSSLFEHPGWMIVLEFMQTRADLRRADLMEMCPEDVPQMVRFSRIKGGIDELRLLPEALGQTLADAQRFVRDYQEEQEAEIKEENYYGE